MNKTKKLALTKSLIRFYAYIFVFWGFYRLIFQFPGVLEELVFKPIVWLVPLYFIFKRHKISWTSIGLGGNTFHVVYFSIFLGMIFAIAALLVNYLKYGNLVFEANIGQDSLMVSLFVSFVTAITEEIPFRGFIFNKSRDILSSEWKANIITSIGWVAIHAPIAIFDWRLGPMSLVVYFSITFIFSIGAGFIYARTKNIAAPILLHVFWQWPIILFR